MKNRNVLLIFFFYLLTVQIAFTQGREARLRTKGYINPQEIVSLDSTMRMDQAFLVISELSKQFAGKVVLDLEKRKNPIGVYIKGQHWRDALETILTVNGLWYQEEADYIRIVSKETQSVGPIVAGEKETEPKPTLEDRDVKISAVFFTTNLNKLQDYGISWNFFRAKDKETAVDAYVSTGVGRGDTASLVGGGAPSPFGNAAKNPALQTAVAMLKSPPAFKFANLDLLIKFFGSNDLGEVLTSPEIVVRNAKEGRIQVGQDIFITTHDIAGNTINQQVSTGTIIKVTPKVYTQNDTDFIYLNLEIEKSDVAPGPVINKANVKTYALLCDGEETIIGGLYETMEQETREGIPILKDLPWWFFGFRYIFGSESKSKTKQELIVLLKAELLKSVRDRISIIKETQQHIIDNKRKEYQKEYEKK